ncbi:MAG: phage portal protein [Syntrophomonas sp.]
MVGGQTTYSGVKVDELSALRHMTVYSCVRVRSESFGSLPVSVYRRRKTGKGQDEAWDHPLYELIHSVPNTEMTSLTWRETMNGHLDLAGNCYSIITRNQRGQVIDIYPWDWRQVNPQRNKETGKLEYQVYDRGKGDIYPADQIFHVPGLGFDGIQGYSVIQMAREGVALGLAISEFSGRFFGQGMNVGIVLQTDQTFKNPKEDAEFIREQFEERSSGLANSHRPMVLHGGLKVDRIPMPLEDAQFVEQYKLNQAQICGLYRVPPHLIANLERATFSNIEHQGIEYVVFSMLPLITRFEQVMNWKLFSAAERQAGYFVKFNVDALLRGDYKSRQEGLAIQRQNGVINADEWRGMEDANPIGGAAGQAYLVNGNMISTENAAGQTQKIPPQNGGE